MKKRKVEIIDLFCGVGGLTKGLINSGLNVVAGFDIDPSCKYAYEHNNNVSYITKDIRSLTGKEIKELYSKGALKILVGCAPCQPFSQMRSKMGESNALDEKYDLLLEFGRLIKTVKPNIISLENVPQLRKTSIYIDFLKIIEEMGYFHDEKVVYCPDYGISQTRRRFVLVGSLMGPIRLIPPSPNLNPVTLKDVIGSLPAIAAGTACPTDALHQSAALSSKNVKRIRASIQGGTWRDWPEELRCECHNKETGKTYSSVYGRLKWDQVGPTITTQFYSYGTGRHGHPEQDRALSLREGALLQTFPLEYEFIDPSVPFSFQTIARHIGNAVPVKLGEVIGLSIKEHLISKNIEVL